MAHPKKNTLHQLLVVMVDSTDFASVESAITVSDFNSGVTKRFYGWNTGGSAATTSGAISRTASLVRSGVFRQVIKATENNYDFVMARFSKTGCAEQIYTWSNVDNDDSDIMSAITLANSRVLVVQSVVSDTNSALVLANSRILLNQSRISDMASMLVVMSGILSDTYSQISDFRSDLHSFVSTTGVGLHASAFSDIRSAIAATTVTISASDVSDIASAVIAGLTINSTVSDIYSLLSSLNSEFLSRVPKAVATNSQLSDVSSDLRSLIVVTGPTVSTIASAVWAETIALLVASRVSDIQSAIAAGIPATITASDMSDIASRVEVVLASRLSDILSAAVQANSRVLVVRSMVSDVQSFLSDFDSDMFSVLTTTGVQLNASVMSDLRSAITAGTAGLVSASDISDIASAVNAILGSRLSDILSAAQQTNSRVLVNQSVMSDVYSLLSNTNSLAAASPTVSDIASAIWIDPIALLIASRVSDIKSILDAGLPATLTTSDISDIASRVDAVLASRLSDILSAAVQANSRVLVVQSRISDVQSFLSDFDSDMFSLLTTTGVQLNASMLSDIRSAITVGSSRILVVQSQVSDTYSQLSDFRSDLNSLLTTTGVQLNASMLSDLRSAITAGVAGLVSASDISDLASAVWAHPVGTRVDSRVANLGTSSDIASKVWAQTAGAAVSSRMLVTLSQVSDIRSALTLGVPLDASTLSDLRSAIAGITATVTTSDISDIASAVNAILASRLSDILSAAVQTNSRVLIAQSMISDAQSKLSDVESNLLSLLTTTGVQLNTSMLSDIRSAVAGVTVNLTVSDISDIASAVAAAVTTITQSDISNIASAVEAILASRLSDILSVTQSTNSRALALQSTTSDIYSLLSDLHSDVGVISGVVSDTYSALQAGVTIGASSLSDLRSAIGDVGVNTSALSDIASAVWGRFGTEPTTVVSPTGTMGAKIDWLAALSRNKITQTATAQSVRNDADSADIASALVSDDGVTFTRGEFGN